MHGCGEFFPRTDEGDEFGKDGVKNAQNRRVEMICFDGPIAPTVPGKMATKGEPQYAKWRASVTDTIDVGSNSGKPAIHVRVFAPDGTQADLHVCDASGAIHDVLPMSLAEREGDHVTFDVDPYSTPTPLRLQIAYMRGTGKTIIDIPSIAIPTTSA